MPFSLLPDNMIPPTVTSGADLLAGTEIGKMIADETTRHRTETIATERRAREDQIARTVDFLLAEQLKENHERSWPDEVTLQSYSGEMRKFIEWCAPYGISSLPTQGSTVAAYIVHCALEKHPSLAELRHSVKAILFTHDVGQHFIDGRYATAAMAFLESAYQAAKDEEDDADQKQ
jgi:hypothetical protein